MKTKKAILFLFCVTVLCLVQNRTAHSEASIRLKKSIKNYPKIVATICLGLAAGSSIVLLKKFDPQNYDKAKENASFIAKKFIEGAVMAGLAPIALGMKVGLILGLYSPTEDELKNILKNDVKY